METLSDNTKDAITINETNGENLQKSSTDRGLGYTSASVSFR